MLPPLALSVVALYGMYLPSCDCDSSVSPSLLHALTRAVRSSNHSAATAFGARVFGPLLLSPSSKYTLVIGDSHASVLAPFFACLASRYHAHVQLRAVPACSPLFGVEKVRVPIGVGQSSVSLAQLEQCKHTVDEWRADVGERSVERVFLISRWRTVVQDGEYFTRGPLAEYQLKESDSQSVTADIPSLNASRVVFERSLRRTVREVQKLGKQVVTIVGKPPDLGRGTFNCKRWLRQRYREAGALRGCGSETGAATSALRELGDEGGCA
ncbi:hypothetical protein FGB62_3g01 [Gracilaria domingensis]|nr:hypothetical protein FGB62_3g01 [Gracilaria domingensis]